jgi:hypothetical protein
MARKAMRDLLLSIGKNSKLIEELVSTKNRYERVGALINHKVIVSEAELPTREEAGKEPREVSAFFKNLEGMTLQAKTASAIIACAGSFEDQGAASAIIACGGSYEDHSA